MNRYQFFFIFCIFLGNFHNKSFDSFKYCKQYIKNFILHTYKSSHLLIIFTFYLHLIIITCILLPTYIVFYIKNRTKRHYSFPTTFKIDLNSCVLVIYLKNLNKNRIFQCKNTLLWCIMFYIIIIQMLYLFCIPFGYFFI